MRRHPELFDLERHLNLISMAGDPLVKLNQVIHWEKFRNIFSDFRKYKKNAPGRPPFDDVVMFKILILQQMYNLSDDQTEFQIKDRFSFMRFLNLDYHDKVPDAKTIWHFREMITQAGLARQLFDRFEKILTTHGLTAKKGMIIDATIVTAPKQHNTKEENETIKNDEIPADWKNNPPKLAQKDCDARWLKYKGASIFGYKNHAVADAKNKFVRDYVVTAANVHDSQPAPVLMDKFKTGETTYADSAYVSPDIENIIVEKKLKAKICAKGYRNRALTYLQKRSNRKKSRTRSRIEHIFGRMHQFGGDTLRSIGLARAQTQIGLQNLAYNIDRFACIA